MHQNVSSLQLLFAGNIHEINNAVGQSAMLWLNRRSKTHQPNHLEHQKQSNPIAIYKESTAFFFGFLIKCFDRSISNDQSNSC